MIKPPINKYLSLLLLFISFITKAEESHYFIRFSVENGLPQNTVNCILQDKQGFMWFGTKDGLSRYDGYRFKNFRYESSGESGLGNNFIRSLYEDQTLNIWVGTDEGIYIYSPLTEKFSRFDIETDEGISIKREVNDIKADKDGKLWFAVDWQGVFSYDPNQNKLTYFYIDEILNAWCIGIDRDNKVWIGTHGKDLVCFDQNKNEFESNYLSKKDKNNISDDIYRIIQDDYNDLLIGTANGGVKKYNLIDETINQLIPSGLYDNIFVRDIIRKTDHELWIGTESGIYIYNSDKNTIKNLKHEQTDFYSLSDNVIYSMYQDREGGMWIGTYFGGINYYPPQYTPFERYYPQNGQKTIKGKRIREFIQDQYGGIWIGTEDKGLSLFDPQNKTFKNFTPDGTSHNIAYHNIHGLMADGDKLWVGTFTHGLNIIDIKTQKVIRHYQKNEKINSLCDNSIFSIYKDHSGTIWIGTIYGLTIYNRETDDFNKVEFTGDTFIYDIIQINDGTLWFASFGQGVFRYNPRNKEWKNFKYDPKDKHSLSHNKIISLYEDSKKTLWLTTEGGGINKYDPQQENFTAFTSNNGLPNNVVYKLLEDLDGNLWFSHNQGLSCFDLKKDKIKTYTLTNGLLGDQFNYKSGLRTSDGTLYFGCLNGFVSFNPAAFTENDYVPQVSITDFKLLNENKEINQKGSNFNEQIKKGNEIRLHYKQSSFNINFAVLSFVAPQKNQFSYILEGFENNPTKFTEQNYVSYSNIPPGKYIFKVTGSNSNGVWNNEAIHIYITILPPFYKSNIAYTLYILLLLSAIITTIFIYKKRIEKKNKRKLEIFENKKNKELYNAKIDFFTTIAHEIRTPLSLINGPLEYILSKETDKKELTENLKIIEKNTNRLLSLSNQLLDFRKVESKGFLLNYVQTDIIQLINDTVIGFKSAMQQKNLNFQTQTPDNLLADIDREAFTKIISNLLINAIKYSSSEIILYAGISEKENTYFYIKISNDGRIIPGELKEKIFEPFYQVKDDEINSGTGLGLPLARSLTELHQGKLYLDNTIMDHNIFILELPLNQCATISLTSPDEESENIPLQNKAISGNKSLILLVEDDRELRSFLTNQLKTHYNIIQATNGKNALTYIEKEDIDLIITDIMMPEMNGLELCNEIKSNLNYSHIPVIMLTAKTDLKSKIEGLEAGADAYIEKPFSIKHLLAQTANLLSNRNKVKQAFIHSPQQDIQSIALTKADENFLNKATQIIHKNMSDNSFNVDTLAEQLNMSRSSLHRKIKGISELTPNDFIQLIRLKKAAELLREGSYRINEICFLVGFSSSSYFSKSFKKQFGVSPKEFTG